LVLDHTIGDIDEAQTRRRSAGSGERRNHGIEQRQRQRRAGASQEGPAGQRLLHDEHASSPSYCAVLIWNGVLLTMPDTNAENV
jgi:hypothetical protein